MKIQTKKSKADNLQVNQMYSNNLYKFFNLETDEHGDFLITNHFIQLFKEKKIKDKEEIILAWELVKLLKICTINFDSMYNFNFHIEDGLIKITLGGDCAYIKNNLSEYEDYLRRLEQEGIQSYIEFELDNNFEKENK